MNNLVAKPTLEPALTNTLKKRTRLFIGILFSFLLLLIGAIILASSLGPISIPFRQTIAIFLDQLGFSTTTSYSDRDALVILHMRLPRIVTGALVGAGLAISGAVMQGIFRNPLVEPGYVGVSSGAAVGAVIALFFGWSIGGSWAVPLSAFVGAALTVFLIVAIWQSSHTKSIATLLLIGIGINALLSSVINIMVASSSSEQELRSIVFWLQGGLEARTWEHVKLIAFPILLGSVAMIYFGRELNMLLLGDEQAASAGIAVKRTRYILLTLTSLVTGSAVAVSGVIGFVGLVVPHIIRLILGPDHRLLLPTSALLGATFLILADLISRIIIQPVTLQVGVVSALIGAPLFIVLILRSRNKGV